MEVEIKAKKFYSTQKNYKGRDDGKPPDTKEVTRE